MRDFVHPLSEEIARGPKELQKDFTCSVSPRIAGGRDGLVGGKCGQKEAGARGEGVRRAECPRAWVAGWDYTRASQRRLRLSKQIACVLRGF